MDTDEPPRRPRKTGPKPRPAEELRRHSVSCRLTDAEAIEVDRRRGKVSRGEWLRRSAMGKPPRVVPEINLTAWADLARAAANLNQLSRSINEGRASGVDPAAIRDLRAGIDRLRAEMIGLDVGERDR